MKAVLCGILAVVSMCCAAALFIAIIWEWTEGCDWLYAQGFHVLALALSLPAFGLYVIIVLIFGAGFAAARGKCVRER